MKKFGFTLAEILISLGIVGVVAALTIPTFTTNTQNQANAAKLSATVSTLENAFTAMIAGEGVDDLTEINGFWPQTSNAETINNYLKGSTCQRNIDLIVYGNTIPIKGLNGSAYNSVSHVPGCMLKSGAVFWSIGGNDTVKPLIIDVNGAGTPNKVGRDVFYYNLRNSGALVPRGTAADCTSNSYGDACAARLVENNYKVDY